MVLVANDDGAGETFARNAPRRRRQKTFLSDQRQKLFGKQVA
jgi:hypothetical protein